FCTRLSIHLSCILLSPSTLFVLQLHRRRFESRVQSICLQAMSIFALEFPLFLSKFTHRFTNRATKKSYYPTDSSSGWRMGDSNPRPIDCECNSLSGIDLYGLGMSRFWMVLGQRPSHSFRID